ncbi:hypothetical protein [Bremerella alba]|uniref:Capsule polysaccharide biosynthesis protein n=1 Tax=Bremerella alba TaxID=980252 RepID=A0A7V8V0Y5_9BACT|nr:hypothetical protein [Bremerella alba]MBA2112923.1 hypothetical protein [Bremerella alba]
MKTLFIPLIPTMALHFATDLELIEQHIEQGKEVEVLLCNSELKSCDINYTHDQVQCDHCMAIRKKGFRLIEPSLKVRRFSELPGWSAPVDLAELDKCKTLTDLLQWKTPTFDVGMALASSLVTKTRDPFPDIDQYRSLLNPLADASLRIHNTLLNILSTEEIEAVYIFNGRFATLRATVRACESKHIKYFTHEIGRDRKHYALFANSLPHSITTFESSARDRWEQASPNSREQIAREWYEKRCEGKLKSRFNFVKEQTSGLLPDNWHSVTERRIAVFPSSEDEFVAIGKEWSNPLFSTQNEGLRAIADAIRRHRLPIHLFIRCHPNLITAHPRQLQEFQSLQGDGVTVIPPEDKVSTYDMMKNADCTLSFGSTAGIEATYWGRPSILAGRSFYTNLGATYNPNTLAELIALLQEDLSAKPVSGALIYAHALATAGISFKHFEPHPGGRGKYRGRFMNPGLLDYLREGDLIQIARRGLKIAHKTISMQSKISKKVLED